MNQRTAEKLADVVLGIAVAGAADHVLRTPSLRRAAFRLAGVTLTATLPAWLRQEVVASWQASGGSGSARAS